MVPTLRNPCLCIGVSACISIWFIMLTGSKEINDVSKLKMAAALLVAAAIVQTGAVSFAHDHGDGTTGTLTEEHPVGWGITSFPLRRTTAGLGAGFGALAGSVEGIMETEDEFADHTFAKASENPLMAPIGLVGAAVAIPVGIIKGGVPQALDSAEAGFNWWDRY